MIDLRTLLGASLGEGYRIVRELSGAGMSRVFLAEELGLDREVVVKVLPPELVAGEHIDRFRAEILQTARLQHPSIVPLLSVGTVTYPTGSLGPYYIMPYIRGETLRSRLEREGPYPSTAVLRILRDVLEALVHAHLHGVIHRDIKPENIFIAGGHAVVTDFGVAKAVSRSGEHGVVTLPGVVVGTPVYMAPEQALGDKNVDHRSDLYSLGVVAYELLAGTPPFAGLRTQQVILAHARANPEPIGRVRPDLPPQFADAIMKCLAKEPRDRWQTADEMLRALDGVHLSDPNVTLSRPVVVRGARRRWQVFAVVGLAGVVLVGVVVLRRNRPLTVGELPLKDAIVVLRPDMPGPDSALLSGPAVTMQSNLLHHLRDAGAIVLDRQAAEGLEGKDLRTLADELGARYVLKLELRRMGEGVRLGVSLGEARSRQLVWGDDYFMADPTQSPLAFEPVADSIAAAVVLQVRTVRTSGRRHPGDNRPQQHRAPEVAGLLSQAQRALRQRTRTGVLESLHLLEEAMAKDSTDAGVHAELSSAYALQTVYMYRGEVDLYEAAARSLAHADRAIALDPYLAESHLARAYVLFHANAPVDSIGAEFQQALELNPAANPGWYSILLMRMGLADSALAEAMQGVAQDPRSAARHINLAWDALGVHEETLAAEAAEHALAIDSTVSFARGLLGRALLAGGKHARCIAEDLEPYLGTKAACFELLGQHDRARPLVDSLLSRAMSAGDTTLVGVFYAQELAVYFAVAGEPQSSLFWIREAYRQAPNGMSWPVLHSRIFDGLRDKPGFGDEVNRLEQRAFAKVSDRARQYLARLGPA